MARKSRTYVELEGVADMRRAFARLRFGALQNVKAHIQESAAKIEAGAKSRVRVLSGATKEGIRTLYRDFGMTASIGSGDPNARSEEFGNANKSGQPFLFPAWEQERPNYLHGIERALNVAGVEASVESGSGSKASTARRARNRSEAAKKGWATRKAKAA